MKQDIENIFEEKPFIKKEQSQNQTLQKLQLTQRLDKLNFSKWHLLVVVSLGITWIFDGYEVSMLSLTSIELKETFQKEEDQIALLGSSYLLGCCIGALFFGILSSNYGRKKLFNVTLLLYGASVFFISIAPSYKFILICRFFTGVGVGGEYTAIFAAIDEIIPPMIRGRTNLILDGSWHLGSLIASISSLIVYRILDFKEIWRLLFCLGFFGIIPIFWLRKKIPESPRWLLCKGRYYEAELVVSYIEQQSKNMEAKQIFADQYLQRNVLAIEREKNQANQLFKKYNFSFLSLFQKIMIKYPRRVLLAAALIISQNFFYNGIFYTFPMILENFYSVEKQNCGFYMIPLSVASFIGPLLLGKYFDTWSRKKMIFLTYLVSGIMLFLIANIFMFSKLNLQYLSLIWFILFIIASPGASSAHLTISEIFPAEMRSQALALFFSIGMGVGGVISPYLFGILIIQHNKFSIFLGYTIASGFMMIAGLVALVFGINAENKSLEDLE